VFGGVVVALAATQSADAEQLKVSHNCKYSEYCYLYEYYDWWEVSAANAWQPAIKISYDDPCDSNAYDAPHECDWTGKPFQNHTWTLGVDQLMASEPIEALGIAVVAGQKILKKVVAFGCKLYHNCIDQYSWLQTSLSEKESDHIAIAQQFADPCIHQEDVSFCPHRQLWGFEGVQ
jgi:hypothetical protein